MDFSKLIQFKFDDDGTTDFLSSTSRIRIEKMEKKLRNEKGLNKYLPIKLG